MDVRAGALGRIQFGARDGMSETTAAIASYEDGSGQRDLIYSLRQLAAIEKSVASQPKVSIITPTWNTKPQWFFDLAVSILKQQFLEWEWCIVDDCSSRTEFHVLLAELANVPNVRIAKLKQSKGISGATNAGLEMSTGEFVCFVDHDDVLTAEALELCIGGLDRGFDAVYTDSDKIDEQGRRSEPFHKPDWSPEYFCGVMYVGHLLCVRRSFALSTGGFDSHFDGIQDYEFFLRFSELTDKIQHVPQIAYHWRTVPGSVATEVDAKGDLGRLQREAVQRHLDRRRLPARAESGDYPHRVKIVPRLRRTWPKVSIIIPTRNSPDILHKCLYTLFSKTGYPNFEVLCIDNDSTDPEALLEMREAPVERILLPGTFNYSKANNLGVKHSAGEFLVFMNNDIEVLTSDWIDHFLYYAEQPDIEAVGALLVLPDGGVQHAGVVLGCRGTADHVLRGVLPSDGYAGSLSCAREVSAVTAACLMTPRVLYETIDGFNEHFFTHYQDVDLCLRIRQRGKRIIFSPHARFVHHESHSRGKYYDFVDRNLLLDSWEPLIKNGDPYYNPNFNVDHLDYTLKH
jgi:O-antigen biosynthesis protein